jgi:3'(2'), 5'-bisphosphate nucleotidase
MTDFAPGSDAHLAACLTDQAGRLLLAVRAELGHGDGPALKAAGDARSQAYLAAALAEHRPHDAVLSEEAADDPVRLSADRVWIVDPLDGTREFSEEGRADWAVHVALWQRAAGERGELAAGAVALPALGVVLSTASPPQLPPPADGAPRVLASRTRAPALVADVVAGLDGTLVPMGSAGAKIAAVVRGHADVYVHAGGQYEWDSAAPVAVARAAGVHATRLDGSPLRYNSANPYLPDLLVCRPELAGRVLALVAG